MLILWLAAGEDVAGEIWRVHDEAELWVGGVFVDQNETRFLNGRHGCEHPKLLKADSGETLFANGGRNAARAPKCFGGEPVAKQA